MRALGWFRPLFAYPDETYADRAAACAAVTGQEAFIQAFDMNPNATLEIGWHLFGEQYERGEFLVDLRGRLRAAEIPETGELPDHLLHVLPLLERLEPEDARRFAEKFLLPALEKIEAGLPAESVFAALVQGLAKEVGGRRQESECLSATASPAVAMQERGRASGGS
jgi:nitrate reductase molybdenum cofactor assembly chaperone